MGGVKSWDHRLNRCQRTQNNGLLPRRALPGAQRLSQHALNAANELPLRGAQRRRISQHNYGRGKRDIFSPRHLPD